MGSLMAGWNSPTLDPKTVRLERNKSLTKEKISAFWKTHKDISKHDHPHHPDQEASIVEKVPSCPNSPRFILHGAEYTVDVEKACKSNDWWTRSSWAFLNEPAEEEDEYDSRKSSFNYTPQFHLPQLLSPNK
ncbi:uncharacterized protein LOC131160407 [Malania oleifera]|uniref:uncharacterized protein LOC131160407 n=1 Tax=Malania oleifera TaxID=397392 RepID=UPI0025AE8827|nr:uncharacterized protein LOC131160407 [Malania oleifera]